MAMKARRTQRDARSNDDAAAPVMNSQLRSRDFAEPDTETPSEQDTAKPEANAGFDAANIPVLGPSAPIQAKLTVGQPGDKYEQEADAVAAKVVNQIHSPAAQPGAVQREAAPPEEEEKLQQKPIADSIQRQDIPEEGEIQQKPLAASIQRQDVPEEEEIQQKPLADSIQRAEAPEEQEEALAQMKPDLQREALPEEEEEATVQAKASGGMAASKPVESAIANARGQGQALSDETRSQMEGAFGTDFSGVRVHTDGRSDELNQSLQARAFTTGQDIFFKRGEFRPGDRGGQELLAHELTHVVQQNSSASVQSVQAKGLENQSFSIQHSVTLFPQPDGMTCWSAAATMILGGNQSIGEGDGELGSAGGLMPKSVPAFAESHGLVVHYPQSWTAIGLAELLKAGPLWIAGALPSLHAVVISAMHGDGSAENTFLTLYDPWPPGKGEITRDIPYAKWVQEFPMATMYILHE